MKEMVDDFRELEGCYCRLLSWCDLLEAIADFLPCRVDHRLCDTIADGLPPLLASTHELEVRVVSPYLSFIMTSRELADAEEHRRTSRQFDRNAAQEVAHVLAALKADRCPLPSDAVGYLLRSFVVPMRQHIRTEREIVGQIRKALESLAPPSITTNAGTEAA